MPDLRLLARAAAYYLQPIQRLHEAQALVVLIASIAGVVVVSWVLPRALGIPILAMLFFFLGIVAIYRLMLEIEVSREPLPLGISERPRLHEYWSSEQASLRLTVRDLTLTNRSVRRPDEAPMSLIATVVLKSASSEVRLGPDVVCSLGSDAEVHASGLGAHWSSPLQLDPGRSAHIHWDMKDEEEGNPFFLYIKSVLSKRSTKRYIVITDLVSERTLEISL